MKFDSLKEKCEYYRQLTDYRLLPNCYVIIFLDGRSFSSKIKKKFIRPFDDEFIGMMNKTAVHLVKNIQGCKFAYVQSDEISLVMTDFDTPTTDSFFGNRLCKLQSLIASMATAKFNNLMTIYELEKKSYEDDSPDHIYSVNDAICCVQDMQLYEFDCKAWNVPTFNDVIGWLLYRQNDCIRNSKQQFAQHYLRHKDLMNKNVDEQIRMVAEQFGERWDALDPEQKYGRFVYRTTETYVSPINGNTYTRSYPQVYGAYTLSDENLRNSFISSNIIPVLS